MGLALVYYSPSSVRFGGLGRFLSFPVQFSVTLVTKVQQEDGLKKCGDEVSLNATVQLYTRLILLLIAHIIPYLCIHHVVTEMFFSEGTIYDALARQDTKKWKIFVSSLYSPFQFSNSL